VLDYIKAGLRIRITLMLILGSFFLLLSKSFSTFYFNAEPDLNLLLIKCESATTGLQALQGPILSLHCKCPRPSAAPLFTLMHMRFRTQIPRGSGYATLRYNVRLEPVYFFLAHVI
jgi:hypothetical protein